VRVKYTSGRGEICATNCDDYCGHAKGRVMHVTAAKMDFRRKVNECILMAFIG
jgi:hypothetical protein